MAGNDWINSYLEAILDVGPGLDDVKSSLLLRERGHFSPTRYFVEEVITGFDETDLHRSWVKAAATRSPQERNTRLENMCWRIWNLARQKKQASSTFVRNLPRPLENALLVASDALAQSSFLVVDSVVEGSLHLKLDGSISRRQKESSS
ncbi:hypothetical protein L484_005397 [Morus notabilis]|uniref:Sucrose-phosphate synthase n=1 Tax=Morus notabilis TaxID=981085 RepID=W9SV18_9ROSA|nr:hypothetical protein L484_005397 [Morus notabilis]